MTEMSDYQNTIHRSRYARWVEESGRRETWPETVERLLSFYQTYIKQEHDVELPPELYTELLHSILSLEVMPSMRAMMTAGTALERNHIAAYN